MNLDLLNTRQPLDLDQWRAMLAILASAAGVDDDCPQQAMTDMACWYWATTVDDTLSGLMEVAHEGCPSQHHRYYGLPPVFADAFSDYGMCISRLLRNGVAAADVYGVAFDTHLAAVLQTLAGRLDSSLYDDLPTYFS